LTEANTLILAHNDPAVDTTNTEILSELTQEADEWKLQRMAKVHDISEM
jgi:hypothetical protein